MDDITACWEVEGETVAEGNLDVCYQDLMHALPMASICTFSNLQVASSIMQLYDHWIGMQN